MTIVIKQIRYITPNGLRVRMSLFKKNNIFPKASVGKAVNVITNVSLLLRCIIESYSV